MSLSVHRAERTDRLADALGDLLAEPLADPFAEEVVVVPARGVERWLTQRLSHRLGVGPRGGDGVCAGVRFLTPHSLVSLLLDRDRDDPWHPDQLVWPLLGVVDEALGEPGFETLSAHLGHDDPPGDDLRRSRRWSVTHRLARLFASYAAQRPRLVADWLAGRATDGCGGELDGDLAWQPELWRRLVAAQHATGVASPHERHAAAVAGIEAGGAGLDLPPRLSLFGHTRLPETEVDLLRALARRRDVHLWLPQVSGALWEDLAETAAAGRVLRAADRSAELVGHPLLASLGRDARELRRSLGPPDADELLGAPEPPDSLLGWLQADLRANREPDAATRAARVRRPDDRSVQVHACHGPARQVDVLREVLVGLLEDDPTLEPRDVLVMCPDVEAYAPLVSAAFGLADVAEVAPAADGHPGHRLRVRLADRSPGATNPLLEVAATLVELAAGRVTAAQVLDLAATPPVRHRFDLDDDALDRLATWVERTGVRWGLDGDHRRPWGLALPANTWADGLRRLRLGAAAATDGHRVVADVLPFDDVGDGDLPLVGRAVELLDRVAAFVQEAAGATDAPAWAATLGRAMAALTSTPPEEAWQQAQLERELRRLGAPAGGAVDEDPGGGTGARPSVMRHADVRSLLRQRLTGRPTRASFRTGTLTVCTMVPMRSVPHRVVCLLGLDDEAFPRNPVPQGDDVLARRPRTGEHDPRSEDRQLLLDAVGAATDALVVTYTGRGVHTGQPRPPAVPVGELLDALDLATAEPVRPGVLTAHPLQPYDEAGFVPGRLVPGLPFTFDAAALAGARAARAPARAEPRLVPVPLHPGAPGDVELADLHDFLANPVRTCLRDRLGLGTSREHEEPGAALPLELDALEQWGVGDRLVRAGLDGLAPAQALLAERVRGTLPPGALGNRLLTDIGKEAGAQVSSGLELREGRAARTVDVDVPLPDGRRVTGSVADLWGHRLVRVQYSRLSAKHRLAGWLDALALAAGRPDESFTVHTVGRGSGPQMAQLPPLDHRAGDWLAELVALHDRALCEPLPLPPKTAMKWAEAWAAARYGHGLDPDGAAREAWEGFRTRDGRVIPGERSDAWQALALGADAAYELLTEDPRGDDPGRPAHDDAAAPPPPHRLGRFAWALWGPVLSVERVMSP